MTYQATLQVNNAIVFNDFTMQPHFRDYMLRVDGAIVSVEAGIVSSSGTAAWGGITGTLSSQTDLNTALTTIPASSIASGTFDNARISESSVTQHEGALTITESQISDLQAYLLAWVAPTFRNESSTTYSLVSGDANKVVRFTGANPAVTIPTGTFAVQDVFYIRQSGTGTLALTTAGLTINGTIPAWSQHVEAGFRCVATDTYDVI